MADGSLIVQRKAGIVAEPLLASPGRRGVAVLAEGSRAACGGALGPAAAGGAGRVRGVLAADPVRLSPTGAGS